MNELSYSFLLPIYQVEQYLSECLESIIQQTYTNFEVILLIDGSRDNSILIAKEYAQKDHRISIYEQENKGILQTRIKLVELAKNDVCIFVDSDDFLEYNLLESIHSLFTENQCDLVLYRFNRMTNSGRIYMKDINLFSDNQLFSDQDKILIWEQFVSNNRLNHVWSKAFKRELFDPKVFKNHSDVYGEDVLISMHLIHNSTKIGYRNLTLYNYRNSDNGLGRNFKRKYLDDAEYVKNEVFNFLNDNKLFYASIKSKYYSSYIKSLIKNIKLTCANYPINNEIIEKLLWIQSNERTKQAKLYLNHARLNPIDKVYYFLFNHKHFWILGYLCKIEFSVRKRLKRLIRN